MQTADKDGHTQRENLGTQPLQTYKIFSNKLITTEAWYPICPGKELKKGKSLSKSLTRQRLVVYRGESGQVYAMDAFCAHMGADLANGRVKGDSIECYFHQWRYDKEGRLIQTAARSPCPKGVQQRSYICEEQYGFIWVYSGDKPRHPVPKPAGLEDKSLVAWNLAEVKLYAHHHVMMIGGIDLQHFASVHHIDADFKFDVEERADETADWVIEGIFPKLGWRSKIARYVLGDRFNYTARFSGGSVVSISYGRGLKFRGRKFALPTLNILWGCQADEEGIGIVRIFIVTEKRPGFFGFLRSRLTLLATILLLIILKDDDIRAFPNMRFQLGHLLPEDQCALRFVKWIEKLTPSKWSQPTLPRT